MNAHSRPADQRGLRVAVLRALMLGDLLCATPALRALRQGLPQAQITLVGLPWARELAERLSSVDRFAALPGWPGLPEQPVAPPGERRRFIAAMRAQRFDWALQMHGSGDVVNPLVAAFGARRTAGFVPTRAGTHDGPPHADAAGFAVWPDEGSEVERLLALIDQMRLPRRGRALEFPLNDADRSAAWPLWQGCGGRPLALVHAGSQLPSRRWPPARFAAVADALADAGHAVLLTGSAQEAPLTQAVAAAMRRPARDLAGRTTLWTLGALVERAALVLCNDTGISHVAAALGTRSVVVSSGGDARRWAPADSRRHRVFWHDLPCRPCAHAVCPIETPVAHPCAMGVAVVPVRRAAVRAIAPASHG
jgi:ADP-heptose:LPS heptosyltransferase